jgi:flagellar hook assembly protein FlgD
MSNEKTVPRILQQQPQREIDQQQQRAGSTDFQSRGQADAGQVEGEGSYTASRDYQKNITEYLQKADVDADAAAAKPRSESEAREIEQAEREARSHSKGER